MKTKYYVRDDEPGAHVVIAMHDDDPGSDRIAYYGEGWREATFREGLPIRLNHPRFSYLDTAVIALSSLAVLGAIVLLAARA